MKTDRRSFLKQASLTTIGAAMGISMLSDSCSSSTRDYGNLPPMPDKAPYGKVLRAGLVGCGSRGTGAANNFLNAGENLQIVALADVFADKLDECYKYLKKSQGIEVDRKNCFVGFDAFKKLIDCGVDVVILATPPHFRPEHFEACISAGKHVFMEKPVAVDPVGVRRIMISAERAKTKALSVVSGTVKRHQRDYNDVYKRVCNGAIGDITGGNCYYNVGKLWHKKPKPEWTEMESMLRNWVNWCWLSGDHIVEQNIHNIDIANWFIGKHPQKALGFGARHRRDTGDQYDFFSVDYVYDNDVHVHNMCRQINRCDNRVGDILRGTKGYVNPENTIYNNSGDEIYKYNYPITDNGKIMRSYLSQAYNQEHINLVTSIRKNLAYNDALECAESTMTTIMGRISAYSGKEVTWDEMMNSELKLGPKNYFFGNVDVSKEIPVPGGA